jgi:hypothetical protein
MELKILHVLVSPVNDGQHVCRRHSDNKRHVIIVNFVIIQGYPASCYFFSLTYKYSPQQMQISPNSPLKSCMHFLFLYLIYNIKFRGFSPPANYTDQATAACRRS